MAADSWRRACEKMGVDLPLTPKALGMVRVVLVIKQRVSCSL